MQKLLFLLLVFAPLAVAQNSQITGRVADPAGAVVVHAEVTIRNTDNGTQNVTATNNDGYFSATSLDLGHYQVTVKAPGFKPVVRSGLTLEVDQVARLDFALEIGNVTEQIQVDATAPLVESETSSIGQVINNKSIVEIPLNGRNAWDLAKLAGATVYISGIGDAGEIPVVSMAGSRTKSQELFLDGGSVQKSGLAGAQGELAPMVDAVEEFKVITNNYAAEYGRTAAGVFTAVTKSGTNRFRGDIFEFFRNDALDARNFFAAAKAPLRYNQFGGTIGGPIRKNKTHFFAAIEATKSTTGSTLLLTVPTQAERNGDFSRLLNAQGNVIPIYNPFSTTVNATAPTQSTRMQFPNNTIPASLLDPVAVKASSYYPLPNVAGTLTGTNNFNVNLAAQRTQYSGTMRVDHVINERDRVYVRYLNQHNNTPQASAYPEPAASGLGPVTRSINNEAQTYLADYIHLFSPTVLNDLKFSGTLQLRDITHASIGGDWPSKLGLTGVGQESFPLLTPQGFSALGSANVFRAQTTPYWQIIDNISFFRGSHSFKAGFEYRHQGATDQFDTAPTGNFSFPAQGTGLPSNSASGNGYASFLVGFTGNLTLTKAAPFGFHNYAIGTFFQDDWKVTSRFTLNLGIRYDLEPGRSADNNMQSGFDLHQINPVAGVPGVVTFAGVNGVPNSNFNVDKNNFAPRVGFAWRPFGDEKTVVRGGYGVFIGGPDDFGFNNTAVLGFATQALLVSPDANLTPALYLKNGVPGVKAPTAADRNASYGIGTGVDFYQRDRQSPYSLQTNFGVQREVRSFLVSAQYIGNQGRKLTSNPISLNQIAPQNLGKPGSLQSLRPFPQFTGVTLESPNFGSSSYHALLLHTERRYANGFQMLFNYTFSKLLDNVNALTDFGGEPGYEDFYNRHLDKAISSLDITHNFSGSVVYDLPWGPGRRWLSQGFLGKAIGGWEVSTLTVIRSGPSYGVTTQTNTCNCFSAGPQRANIIGNPDLPSGQQSVQRWFNTAAFSQPVNYTFGNAGRSVGRSPGAATVDAALSKNFKPVERVRVQFRGEFFNVLNRANFGVPATAFGASNFGIITTAAPGRIVQAALKIYF